MSPRAMLPLVLTLALTGCGSGRGAGRGTAVPTDHRPAPAQQSVPSSAPRRVRHPAARRNPSRPIAVRTVILHVVDPARTMTVLGRVVRRSFNVVVRYPVGIPGRLPLIVFGHGFAVTPTPYSRLLDAWTRAGYVVAAPIFPLENAEAPGGPNENDLPNQPADMSLVVSSLEGRAGAQAARLAAKVNFRRIALAGQSDGGDTALSAAYGPQRDPRISAAVILSGAEDPFAPRFDLSPAGPPLLATQGTADTINPPWQTYQYFQSAPRPKYLLKLFGASHLPPYTQAGTELTIVERITLAFLNRYLKGQGSSLARYVAERSAGPGSELIAYP